MFEKKKFFDAVYLGDIEAVKKLAVLKPALVNLAVRNMTALGSAICRGNDAMVACLLDLGADPRRVSTFLNAALLAAREGQPEILKRLHGVDPGLIHETTVSKDSTEAGWSALMLAAYNGYEKCVAYLLAQGVAVDNVNRAGHNALYVSMDGKKRKDSCVDMIRQAEQGVPRERFAALFAQMENVLLTLEQNPPVPANTDMQPREDAAPAPQGWVMLAHDRVAHISRDDLIGCHLTTVFNFATRERLQIARNLDTGRETQQWANFSEIADGGAIHAAADALTQLGGDQVIAALPVGAKKTPLLGAR